jgi:molecular chaperone GrpE
MNKTKKTEPKTTQGRKKTTPKNLDKIKKLSKENQLLKDQLLRKVAEFDNYKKRSDREALQLIQNANEKLILDLLPILDDMERFFQHIEEQKNLDSVLEGSQLIYKKFVDILEKEGLEPMKAVSETFDPEMHDALMQSEDPKSESGTIISEYSKGYLLNGKVIRHAQVIVAK